MVLVVFNYYVRHELTALVVVVHFGREINCLVILCVGVVDCMKSLDKVISFAEYALNNKKKQCEHTFNTK